MCESDDVESASIDLDDAETMALIEEMRNAEPSKEVKRKIRDHRYNQQHREEKSERNRKWREAHAERYAEYQREYCKRPEVKKRHRDASRERYHSNPEWREQTLAKQRARRAAWSPERRAEEARKSAERYQRRKAKKAKLEAKRKHAREHMREVKAAWTPEQREEHKRKEREYQREYRERQTAENE